MWILLLIYYNNVGLFVVYVVVAAVDIVLLTFVFCVTVILSVFLKAI